MFRKSVATVLTVGAILASAAPSVAQALPAAELQPRSPRAERPESPWVLGIEPAPVLQPQTATRTPAAATSEASRRLISVQVPTVGEALLGGLGGAVVGAMFGGYIEAFLDPDGEIIDMWPMELALPGLAGGVVLSFLD